jgi:hypothetical protein
MDDICNYAFKKAVSELKISMIKQCLDAKIAITNNILESCVSQYYCFDNDENNNNFTERIELFNTIFGKTNEGYKTDKYPYERGTDQRAEKNILVMKIFDLLLEYISDDLIFSTNLITKCISRKYYFIKKIIKTGRYGNDPKLLFTTLDNYKLSDAKILLDNGYNIHLEKMIYESIKCENSSILQSIVDLKIDINSFRPMILNYCKCNSNMICTDIKQILIDNANILSKNDLSVYMMISLPETLLKIIEQLDVCNYILSIYVQLIQKSNTDYIIYLQNTKLQSPKKSWLRQTYS